MDRFLPLALVAIAWGYGSIAAAGDPPLRYWRGNLHTHTLWSDGDGFPEMIAEWYRDHGYHFLALTDHNLLSEGVRWMSLKDVVRRSDAGALDRYRERFGDSWVETRGTPGEDDFQVRLKPMPEYRALVEERGRFLLIAAEEISNSANGAPVHVNAVNLAETIPAVKGPTVREVMEVTMRAVETHAKKFGREVLPHLNHPNYKYAVTAEDLATVVSEQFFEVYNGHPGVEHLGDDEHVSVEAMWDIANAIRLNDLLAAPLMGIATDDSHEHHGREGSRPGRGWVMTRSRYLTPESLVRAMKRGDFYASSGVELSDVGFDSSSRTLSLQVTQFADETYRTEFVTVVEGEYEGQIVATVEGLNPTYTVTDNQLFVRAVVTSSAPADDPSFAGQTKQAWTQPVGWKSFLDRGE